MFPDTPNLIFPESSVQKETQARWLIEICEEHVKKFVFNADGLSILVEQTAELQDANKQEGRWKCRAEGCMATYVYHSSRVKIVGLAGKRFLHSPPPPPSFLFLLSFQFSRRTRAEPLATQATLIQTVVSKDIFSW